MGGGVSEMGLTIGGGGGSSFTVLSPQPAMNNVETERANINNLLKRKIILCPLYAGRKDASMILYNNRNSLKWFEIY